MRLIPVIVTLLAILLAWNWWSKTPLNPSNAEALAAEGMKYYFGTKDTEPDYTKAVMIFRKAAARGSDLAQLGLGACYYAGKGVPQDYTLAAEWYKKSAEQGNGLAQMRLAGQYASGEGVPKDDAESARWCLLAAEQGMPEAEYIMAINYANGLGVPQDENESLRWLKKAADHGYDKARESSNENSLVDSDTTETLSKTGPSSSDSRSVWKFQFGDSYAKCTGIMKALKSSGTFSELSVGKVEYGWMPGADSIQAKGRVDLGGILSSPCENVELLCRNDRLVGIRISYSFKQSYRVDLFPVLTRDAERMLGSKAKLETKEDDVGNRKKTATIQNGKLTIKIEDTLDGPFAPFTPELRIVSADS